MFVWVFTGFVYFFVFFIAENEFTFFSNKNLHNRLFMLAELDLKWDGRWGIERIGGLGMLVEV
jgi:hypothetical protein